MKERIISILNRLKAKGEEGLTGSIVDFEAKSDYIFQLRINKNRGFDTYFKYETSGTEDEVLRVELSHFFGHLDLNRVDNPAQFLVEMLEQNVPSFRGSSACLGLKASSPSPLVCLNATHIFLATLSDSDIAEVLSIAIFDLKMGFMFTFPPAVVTWDPEISSPA